MAATIDNNRFTEITKVLCEQGIDGLANAVTMLINEAMRIEQSRYLNAKPYERTNDRVDYANGFKPKHLKTRIGNLELSIPQVRAGDFYPSFLERGIRSERALKVAIAEMYIQGVSTRKVSAILEELCGLEVTSTEVSRASKLLDDEFEKWRNKPLGQFIYLILDARYEKVRQDNCVVDSAVLIAYGVDSAGKRHILGVSISLSEAELHWRNFLESLAKRGLHGLQLIISDAHAGLKAAIRAVFPAVQWQRCQFHLQQNAQAYVPKKEMKAEVADDIRIIFNAHSKEEAERLLKIIVAKYSQTASKLSNWLENNIPEGLNIFHFDKNHRIKIRTSNLAERVNREIKRRTKVVNIFSSVSACERLITGVLIEIDEKWSIEQRYLIIDK